MWVKNRNRTKDLKRYGLGGALDMTGKESTEKFEAACVLCNKVLSVYHGPVLRTEQRNEVPTNWVHGR